MAVWGQDNNNLSLNVSKTKEMIVDYRKRRAEHAPIHIDRAVVEWVKSFKFLAVSTSLDTSKVMWTNYQKSKHTHTFMKRE